MKTIFFGTRPEFTGYRGYEDAVRLASHFNTNLDDVLAITTDDKCRIPGRILCRLEHLSDLEKRFYQLGYMAHLRWSVIGRWCKAGGITGPVYCPDWDMLTFGKSEDVLKPFLGFKVSRSRPSGHPWSAAYLIADTSILYDYCKFVESLPESDWLYKGDRFSQDLHTWDCWARLNGVECGNLADVVDGAVFDHNIHVGEPTFRMVKDKPFGQYGFTKQIVWEDRVPHFVLADGTLVKAKCIHCWGSYKSRTKQLVDKAI